MRKTAYILIAASLLMWGCAEKIDDIQEKGHSCEVTLNVGCDTKTAFAEENEGVLPVVWNAGDRIGLYVVESGFDLSGSMNVSAALESGTAGYSKGTFTANLFLTPSQDYTVDIYYPYTSAAGTDRKAVKGCVPAVQTQASSSSSGHLGFSGSFSYAEASFTTPAVMDESYAPELSFVLDQKTSAVWLQVSAADQELAGWKLKRVTLSAPEGNPITGEFVYSPADDALTVSENSSESVSLALPAGAALSSAAPVDLYMVVLPCELSGKTVEIRYLLESADAAQTRSLCHTRTLGASSTAFARGEVHRFVEQLPAADAEGWTYAAGAIDLSEGGTANCYVVSSPGTYSFDATVIGNGQKGILTPLETTFFHTDNASIEPATAELLWQTEKGLITDLNLENGRVVFKKSPDVEFGNALIAVKDAEGTVLWSWHIWCTELGALHTYISDTGTFAGMDRNLGATYAATELVTDLALKTRGLGLYYMWGRKDPFVGPSRFEKATAYTIPTAPMYDIEGNAVTRPAYVSASATSGGNSTSTVGTSSSVTWTIEHPTTYVASDEKTNNDWFSSGLAHKGTGPKYRPYYLWGNPEGYDYKSSAKPTPVKTIYDPCPVGYMVPPPDFYHALKDLSPVTRDLYGHVLTPDGGTTLTWYPHGSLLAYADDATKNGNWATVNMIGYYRTSAYTSAASAVSYCLQIWGNGSVNQNTSWASLYGFSIRCVQEIN